MKITLTLDGRTHTYETTGGDVGVSCGEVLSPMLFLLLCAGFQPSTITDTLNNPPDEWGGLIEEWSELELHNAIRFLVKCADDLTLSIDTPNEYEQECIDQLASAVSDIEKMFGTGSGAAE